MCYELALKRMQAVSFTNCCWTGHREGSVTKFRSCRWNSVVAAWRRAETSPCRITVSRLHRIAEVVWAAACVDNNSYYLLFQTNYHFIATSSSTTSSLYTHTHTELGMHRETRTMIKRLRHTLARWYEQQAIMWNRLSAVDALCRWLPGISCNAAMQRPSIYSNIS